MASPTDDLDALAAARALFGPTATSFRFLAVGDRFQFPGRHRLVGPVFTKTATNGWFQDGAGRKFRTGGGAAVVPVASS